MSGGLPKMETPVAPNHLQSPKDGWKRPEISEQDWVGGLDHHRRKPCAIPQFHLRERNAKYKNVEMISAMADFGQYSARNPHTTGDRLSPRECASPILRIPDPAGRVAANTRFDEDGCDNFTSTPPTPHSYRSRQERGLERPKHRLTSVKRPVRAAPVIVEPSHNPLPLRKNSTITADSASPASTCQGGSTLRHYPASRLSSPASGARAGSFMSVAAHGLVPAVSIATTPRQMSGRPRVDGLGSHQAGIDVGEEAHLSGIVSDIKMVEAMRTEVNCALEKATWCEHNAFHVVEELRLKLEDKDNRIQALVALMNYLSGEASEQARPLQVVQQVQFEIGAASDDSDSLVQCPFQTPVPNLELDPLPGFCSALLSRTFSESEPFTVREGPAAILNDLGHLHDGVEESYKALGIDRLSEPRHYQLMRTMSASVSHFPPAEDHKRLFQEAMGDMEDICLSPIRDGCVRCSQCGQDSQLPLLGIEERSESNSKNNNLQNSSQFVASESLTHPTKLVKQAKFCFSSSGLWHFDACRAFGSTRGSLVLRSNRAMNITDAHWHKAACGAMITSELRNGHWKLCWKSGCEWINGLMLAFGVRMLLACLFIGIEGLDIIINVIMSGLAAAVLGIVVLWSVDRVTGFNQAVDLAAPLIFGVVQLLGCITSTTKVETK